jgi:hypothetical protein
MGVNNGFGVVHNGYDAVCHGYDALCHGYDVVHNGYDAIRNSYDVGTTANAIFIYKLCIYQAGRWFSYNQCLSPLAL